MANPVLEDWNRLCKMCAEARLPDPVIKPGGLPDTFTVEIPEYTQRISKNVDRAICDCIIWVRAWAAGYKAACELWSLYQGKQ